MTKIEETIEKATIINDVVLTDKATRQLKDLQQNDNEKIHETRNYIADAICQLAIALDNAPRHEDEQQLKRTISDLSYTRDYFSDLKKP